MDNIEMAKLDNFLEIHYWFNDDSHLMDASIENRCTYEVLGIIHEIAKLLSHSVIIETLPLGEGGLLNWLRITFKTEEKKATITTAIIGALVTVVLITPIGQISQKLIDKVFEDTELVDLQKQKLRSEILKNQKETLIDEKILNENLPIKKKKSNFYQNLEKYPKVNKVSFSVVNRIKQQITEAKFVARPDFKLFILATDEIDPLNIEEAHIEIIAPVLKKGKYKWIGIYQGEPISFTMKSNEFKEKVQFGEVEFKNGFSINCLLHINRKVTIEGSIQNINYEVLRVNKYFENEHPVETKEGKKHKHFKEISGQQLQLFSKTVESEN